VPVLGPANGKAITSDYEQLIGGGFLLKWQRAPVSGKFSHQIVLFVHLAF
jgi:hypothetical protein